MLPKGKALMDLLMFRVNSRLADGLNLEPKFHASAFFLFVSKQAYLGNHQKFGADAEP
jgi:hypothetical protein